MSDNKPAAPLPRDYDQASFSEMVPFRSKKIRLWRSPIFYFVAVTAIFNVLLFGARVGVISGNNQQAQVETFGLIVQVAMFYLMAMALLLVHSYAKTDKSIAYYVFPCLFVYLFLSADTLWHYYAIPFDILGGGPNAMSADTWPARLWAAFTEPGLREELVKAMPALLCAAMTVWPARFSWMPRRLYQLMRVRSPLDGVLMGIAAGCAFLFAETGGEYVSGALAKSYKASGGNLQGAFGDALMLMLPRVMNGWVGHMAWAGIFGYFIGLAVVRPREGWKLILGGWLAAALLHGLWDSDAPGDAYALFIIGGVGGLLAIACLVKARQLDMSLFGRHNETFGSIVVGAPPGRAAMPAAAAPFAAQAVAPPVTRQTTPAAPPAAAAQGFVLDIGGVRMALQSGGTLDLGAQPALAGRAAGVKAIVTQHPTNPNVLGLKNIGDSAWYAQLRDNSVQSVERQRSLRLAAGMTIDFGAGIIGQVGAG